MKAEDLYANANYKSLTNIDKLRTSKVIAKDVKTQTKLFTIVTAALTLSVELKKSSLPEKEVILSNLAKIANTVNGLIDSDRLNREDAKVHINKLKKRSTTITKIVESQLKELYKNKVPAITFDEINKLTANIGDADTKEIEKILDANSAVIKGLQKHADSLPLKKDDTKRFTMLKLPLVAISPLSKSDFAAGGFVVSALGMYAVLEDQLIIGINPDNIDSAPLDKYLSMIIKGLSNKTGSHYITMPHPKPYKNSGLIYYWVVEEKLVNRVRSQTGKNFSVNKWGFAFK